MRRIFLFLPFFFVAAVLFSSGANAGAPPMMGMAAPFQMADLPMQSPIRQSLQALAAPQRARAMAWLHSFSFPPSDLASLRVDNAGSVYYRDTIRPGPGGPVEQIPLAAAVAPAFPAVDAFKLHSKPGSPNKVFLDFDGHKITGTAWNETVATYYAAPFDLDNKPASFNNDERSKIAEIWHRIAEDYAPFDLDVTTEEPEGFGPRVGHVLFTRDKDLNGRDMPAKGSAGVAYVNVWGFVDYASTYSPALVYYNTLDSGYPPYMAEAGAHEFGHNLGLSHDGIIDGSLNYNCINNNEYFCGLGSGNISWAPIMGAGYYANVTEWSKGEYPSANNTQDDIDIIKNRLNYRPDDTGNVLSQATQLVIESNGAVIATDPQSDPSNSDSANKGIIETRDDTDMFWFNAAAGPVKLTINPSWQAYYRSNLRGANLDIRASLYNASGKLVSSADPSDETYATLSANLAAGKYYLAVTGVGNSATPYSDYGSLGQYFISGNVAAAGTPDSTPPKPNPMIWSTKPYAVDANTLSMAATTASDENGPVEYLFRCLSGGTGCADSGWQRSRKYVITNLAAGASYSFSVQARDNAGNVTAPSVSASATTKSNRAPVAKNDSSNLDITHISLLDGATVQVTVKNILILPVLSNDSDPDGDSLNITSVGSAKYGDVSQEGKTIIYLPKNKGIFNFNLDSDALSDFLAGDSFSYTVEDGHGGKATATVTVQPGTGG